MDGVLIYPTVTMNEPPLIGEGFDWVAGPLAKIDETGMPAEPVLAKISDELPGALTGLLERSHIDLWDSPIQTAGIQVVGLEFCPSDDDALAPAQLVVHFISDTANIDTIDGLLSVRTSTTRTFLSELCPRLVLHPFQKRAFAVVAEDGESNFSVHGNVFVIESENPKLQSLLHCRLTLSLQVAMAQYYSLQMGLLMWPDVDDSNPTWDDFHKSMSFISQKLIWPKISLNADAQLLYEGIRATLGIEATLNQVLADIDRRNQIVQAKSAQNLNSYGLVFAVSGLVATWIGIGVATTSPAGAIGGVLTLAAAGLIKYKNRKLL